MRLPATLAMVALAAFLPLPLPAHAGETIDPAPRVAVMSAFEPEWEELRAAMAGPAEHAVNGTTFVAGRLEGKDVVLLLTGVSMVNAAMTTQLAVERFNVERTVLSGIVGGVELRLSTWSISSYPEGSSRPWSLACHRPYSPPWS